MIEIRNTIYKLVFDKQEPRPRAWYLNILRTCKAIHDEAAPMAYASRTHVLHVLNHGSFTLRHIIGSYESNEAASRGVVWRMTRRKSSIASQLSLAAGKLRPHIAGTIVSLHVHETMWQGPPWYLGAPPIIKRLIPDVLNIAEPLGSLVHLRQFLWTMHRALVEASDHVYDPIYLDITNGPRYIRRVSAQCASGISEKIVRVLANILHKWPALEELTLRLPQLNMNVTFVMAVLAKGIPLDRPIRTRQTHSGHAPRITVGDDALTDGSQLRLRTNRTTINSNIVLKIRQDASELRCIRPSWPEEVPTVPAATATSAVPTLAAVPVVPAALAAW